MVIAICVLSALLTFACVSTYLMFRGAVAFMNEAEVNKVKYLELLVTFDQIKKALSAEGILLLSSEEAAKLAETKADENKDFVFNGPAPKKGEFH